MKFKFINILISCELIITGSEKHREAQVIF